MTSLDRARRSEERLALQTEILVRTLATIRDGVVTTDRRGHIQYMNPVAGQMGSLATGGTGRAIREVFPFVDFSTALEPRAGSAATPTTIGGTSRVIEQS